MKLKQLALALCCSSISFARYATHVPRSNSGALTVRNGYKTVLDKSQIVVGNSNTTVKPVTGNEAKIDTKLIAPLGGEPTTIRVDVESKFDFVGVKFNADDDDTFYGVWEYPWGDNLDDNGIMFDLKGVGNSDGVNWDNARAPFFFSTAGYGVYADTLAMGSYNFKSAGEAEFIFNTSSLTYYIIFPEKDGDYKSIIQQYVAGLSETITMPPDSGYGPTFWSDNFEQDFHGDVKNAQENYFDVVNHLYDYQIHASSMFADRPYGTGNMSFGNFDFDPAFYPTPEEFIANLSRSGYDFQVWVANRAFNATELYNTSVKNGWLFPGYSAETFNGPALNLSIPAAYNYFKEHLRYFPSVGVKGFKIDRGEEEEMPVYEQNIQMTLFEQLCYDVMAEKWGPHGFYTFARSVVDRSRSKTNVWNGDSHSNYSGLAYSVSSGLRAGLLGYSTWGSDTGGYIRGTNDPSEELWARWMWFSTFSTVYELVLGTNHTPYYPPYTSNLVSVLKDTANLHHDLIPYIRSFTYQSTQNGLPVMRAPFLELPNDKKAWGLKDEYFFGTEVLVAPIITAGGSRSVYFPTGTKYLEYFGKKNVYAGGTTTKVSLDVDSVPAYVKAGAIIPRGDIIKANNLWTKDWKPHLTIEIYPSWNVPHNTFTYWNGESAVEIIVSVDSRSRSVQVWTNGSLGVDASYAIYTKDGCKEGKLNGYGGAKVHGIETLFE